MVRGTLITFLPYLDSLYFISSQSYTQKTGFQGFDDGLTQAINKLPDTLVL